jgi:hypothetical protein
LHGSSKQWLRAAMKPTTKKTKKRSGSFCHPPPTDVLFLRCARLWTPDRPCPHPPRFSHHCIYLPLHHILAQCLVSLSTSIESGLRQEQSADY